MLGMWEREECGEESGKGSVVRTAAEGGDNDGPYYWHIKSGTITRTPPEPSQTVAPAPLRAERRNREPDQNSGSVGGTVTRSNTSSALSELSDSRPRTAALDNAYK
ncbi:hypothetical protein E2C01_077766 [Portunus trituberculatus]|uniref:Uncharacterized protein n=1 Tax=Portunus trituberculatus TaxID=210409 RepID=A0A5B7IMW9_PORTR|nr:hypothetical protein [Portunus trituberculatus]